MKQLQEVLNVDGLIVGVVMEYGDWRGRINWGAVVGFSARLVEVDSGSLIWATSANRDTADDQFQCDRSCGITGRPQRSFNPTR